MMEYLLSLLLASILLCTSNGDAKDNSQDGEETPINYVIMDGIDITSKLGAELVQGLHIMKLKCQMNISAADIKHQKKITKMISYYEDLEKVVRNPQFPEISKLNVRDVEANTHHSIKQLEKNRKKDLHRILNLCNAEQEKWITDKFLSLLNDAKSLLAQNSTKYIELLLKMGYYKEKLTTEIAACKNESPPELLFIDCYIDEMTLVVDSVSHFLNAMEDIFTYYSDDEDVDNSSPESTDSGEGSGDEEVNEEEQVNEPTSISSTEELDSSNEDTPESQQEATPLPGQQEVSPPTSQQEVTPPQQKEAVSTTQEEMITSQKMSSPSDHPTPILPWVEHAFEDVAKMKDTKPKLKEKGEIKKSSNQGSKISTMEDRTNVEIYGSLDGNEVVIDLEVGPPASHSTANPGGLVFDGEGSDDEDKGTGHWIATRYTIISFSVTLGVILIITVIAISIAIIYKMHGRKVPPNITGKEMLVMMKKTGYVNPTYKYYTKT